ncbi:hypothetical protein [Quadrisphaera setariae]|uniref:Prevent-host-death family protein n=1 Tax=Quadrisphaera setariae TaxID=2593304 RepID=A0A5C8Z2T9_9ACTN|nr:hypothetical protein [Quadrisphaera setariae]TXR51569.1 hypothetical protein FMM08_22220 [Quadrisphaera setariae]
MTTTLPLSRLVQHPTEVATLVAEQDIVLDRRNAEDLYLSTVERHEQESQGLRITTSALAALARVRPDLAGDALSETLPWMVWLPVDEKTACLQELLDNLRAGAETSQLRPFFLNLAAWRSTAITWSDPDLAAMLLAGHDGDGMSEEDSLVAQPAT